MIYRQKLFIENNVTVTYFTNIVTIDSILKYHQTQSHSEALKVDKVTHVDNVKMGYNGLREELHQTSIKFDYWITKI